MQAWTKVWLREMGLTGHEYIPCEIPMCGRPVVDIHHIRGRIGLLRTDIKNLVGLCREHHCLAHANVIKKEDLDKIVESRK